MQRRFRWTCPVCGRPDLKNISTHLLQVYGLSSEERKPYLKQATVSSWQPHIERSPHITMSNMNVEKPGQKRVKQSEHSSPAKGPRIAARMTSLANKSCPEFNFRHKFSLLIVGPTLSGKKYILSNKFKNTIVSCMKIKRVFAFFCTTINGKNVTKSSKNLSVKASDLKEVCPNCLKICVKSMHGTTTSSSFIQILADLFGECYAYHFGVNSTEPTRVETKPVGKHSTATKTTSSRKKPVQTVT